MLVRRRIATGIVPGCAGGCLCPDNTVAGSWRLDTLGDLREAAKARAASGKLQVVTGLDYVCGSIIFASASSSQSGMIMYGRLLMW
jgi:hypothetical protein